MFCTFMHLHFDSSPIKKVTVTQLSQDTESAVPAPLFYLCNKRIAHLVYSHSISFIFTLLIKWEVMHSIIFIGFRLMLNIYNADHVQKCAC